MKPNEPKIGELRVWWIPQVPYEHEGIVDWEAIQYDANPIPIRDKDGVIRWIERRNLSEVSSVSPDS